VNCRAPELAIVALMSVSGCGEIQEVPAEPDLATDGTSTGGSPSTGGSSTGSSTPDDDRDVSTSEPTDGPGDDTDDSSGAAPPIQFCGNLSDGQIPDDGTFIEFVIDLPAGVPATSVTTSLRIEHPRADEIHMQLVAPDSEVAATLMDAARCEGANIELLFDDEAGTGIDEQCDVGQVPALHATVQPLEPLAPLLDGPTEGVWTLRVQDTAPMNQGVVAAWCLNFWDS
jgi:hypothetical protein